MNLGKTLVFVLLASTVLTPSRAPANAQQLGLGSAEDVGEAGAVVSGDVGNPDVSENTEALDDSDDIVVTGQRGAVAGDIPPDVQLDSREILALGAGDLTELLDALAPQTRSGRGRGSEGGPVILLNGRRISGFSEIQNIPPEAIERVDILAEEVALKYGYRADQRVVNFVLRSQFRATTAELESGLATDGGRVRYEADANMLMITGSGRTSINAEYERSSPLFESERNIIRDGNPLIDDRRFRTLISETDQFTLNGTVNRKIFGNVSATVNARFNASSNQGFLGLRSGSSNDPLTRQTDTLSGTLGAVLNGDISPWRWSLIANYARSGSDSLTERNGPTDRAETMSEAANGQFVANGTLLTLPAGEASASVRVGADAQSFESDSLRGGIEQSRDLSRQRADAQANIDLPIASRRTDVLSALGNLSLNFNAEIEQYSDFGTLRTLGGGVNWSPIEEINLLASMTDEDGAPSMQQLGDPLIQTPNVRVFDFVRGETVDITRLDGGNPNLIADRRRVYKIGLNARPLKETDLSFSANYTNSRIVNPIASFPTATAEIEAAFPERFLRNGDGRLLQIDGRPVNFARSDREELRWGINFSKTLGPEPSAGGRGRPGVGGMLAAAGVPNPPGAGQAPGGAGRPGGGGGGFRGGGGGGGGGGGIGRFGGGGPGGGGSRMQLGLYHTWYFEDEVLIREGVPTLDFLDGSAAGGRGGRSEHEVEFQARIFKNGFGGRVTANWQSDTFVRGAEGNATNTDLFFSDFATVNLRLFADMGQQQSLIRDHPWLQGTRVSLFVNNLFNSRLDVKDASGVTPLSYQPAYLDPLGRSIQINIRKQFF